MKLAPNRQVRVMAALALARAGDTEGAERLTTELDKNFPLDTLVQRYWLPAIRAAVALDDRDPNRAIELLKVSSTVELGAPASVTVVLCPAYLRGEAYLMLHEGNSAAAEFQKFIDHRGLVANFHGAHRPAWAWLVHMHSMLQKIGPPLITLWQHIKTSLLSGTMQTPAFPSSSKPGRSTLSNICDINLNITVSWTGTVAGGGTAAGSYINFIA